MSYSSTALKYGEALLDVVTDSDVEVDRAGRDLQTFEAMLQGSAELAQSLHNPAIPFAVKRRIIEQVSQLEDLSRPVVNLMLVLLENGRMPLFDEVEQAYRALVDERAGIVAVDVASARPLSDHNRGRLEAVLKEVTGSEVKCRFEVDPALLGGLKIQIGSKVFDGTVSTHLEEIKSAIVGAG